MALIELVHSHGSHQVSVVPFITKCDLFKNNLGVAIAPYQVKPQVSLDDIQDFVSALEDKLIDNKDRNSWTVAAVRRVRLSGTLEEDLSASKVASIVCHAFRPWKSELVSTKTSLLHCSWRSSLRSCASTLTWRVSLRNWRDFGTQRRTILSAQRQQHRLRTHPRSLHHPLQPCLHPPQRQQ
jgi:hypothetical protein